ncbi:MAG: hypothetical protein OWU84_12265 [Firmicutes bacterium]|nr:hypothetical protein [Bacillota bacterium]
MAETRLDRAFAKIYASYLQRRPIARDDARHPEYTEQILERLGRPDSVSSNLVVTGSKGKGSTAALTAQFLRAKGESVGLFTSPHLLDYFERIRVDGVMISPAEFLARFDELEPSLDAVAARLPAGHYVGPNGLYAVLAALHFRARQVRWGVYETGRGALYDDVARIRHEFSAITLVLAEHVAELGPTLQDIARHKAGVVTPETRVVVLGADQALLKEAVMRRLEELGHQARVITAPDVVRAEAIQVDGRATAFDLVWRDGRRWSKLCLPSLGPLVHNVATAAVLAETMAGPVDEAQVRAVLERFRWPGRGEVMSEHPYVLLDAAVRPESLEPLLGRLPPFDTAVLSIPDGKDRAGMLQLVRQHAKVVVLTRTTNQRLPYQMREEEGFDGVRWMENVSDALAWALGQARPTSRVLLAGTLSFIADVYRYFGRQVD